MKDRQPSQNHPVGSCFSPENTFLLSALQTRRQSDPREVQFPLHPGARVGSCTAALEPGCPGVRRTSAGVEEDEGRWKSQEAWKDSQQLCSQRSRTEAELAPLRASVGAE